jgi:3-carboxy-cis,cis-muconate cycloisomerase
MSDQTLLDALLQVEQAWLDALVAAGVAPERARADLTSAAQDVDPGQLAASAETGGNPVIPLLEQLRSRLPDEAAAWLHRGLTSQDTLDSAMVLCAHDAVGRIRAETTGQVSRLVSLAREHRDTPVAARTLTQHAVPTRFGLTVATWLQGVLDADDGLAALRWPVQSGGAAGTLSALVELGGRDDARVVRREHAAALGLDLAPPWHTSRAPVTRLGDAVVGATDAWGRIARDVLVLARPEVGELVDGSAGGSSTMPHKQNPVLAVLVRRAALAAPSLGATLHLAASEQVDQRADGAWHVEWATTATLLRRAVTAAAQTRELLDGLVVRADVMAARVAEVEQQLRGEQAAMADLAGHEPSGDHAGLTDDLIDAMVLRAESRGTPREETR